MRIKARIFILYFFLLTINSCTKNPDGSISALPAPASNLIANAISETEINLTWSDNSTNESGFKIERKTLGGFYSVVGTVGSNITLYNDKGLTPNTTYYYRIFSYNDGGSSPTYSNEVNATTIPSSAPTTICNQIWMTKNLDVAKYRNGDIIPEVKNETDWKNLTTGAWQHVNGDPSNDAIHGKLYNWYAVNDPRGLAPQGWHIPSVEEINSLALCLGGESVAGGKMKAISTLWAPPNQGATNSSGWTGLPTVSTRPYIGIGDFFETGGGGVWWTSTPSGGTYKRTYRLRFDSESLGFMIYDEKNGYTVRCLKD